MFMLRQPELYRQLQKVVDEALDGNDVSSKLELVFVDLSELNAALVTG